MFRRLIYELGLNKIMDAPHLLLLVIASLVILVARNANQENRLTASAWERANLLNVLFIVITLVHTQFAGIGWFFRYEAYLVILGITVAASGAASFLPMHVTIRFHRETRLRDLAVILLLVLAGFPFGLRAASSLAGTPQAAHNIFDQQFQMGIFLRQFYGGQAVAANDIGAINYLGDLQLLDLSGLSSMPIARLRLQQAYTKDSVSELARQANVQVAMVYDYWPIPVGWIKVGTWKIPDNVINGSDTVSIYAVDPAAAEGLIANLKTFARELPAEVEQSGEYIR